MLSETERNILLQESLERKSLVIIQGPEGVLFNDNNQIKLTRVVIDVANIIEITKNKIIIIFRGLNDNQRRILEEIIKNILENIHPGGIKSGGDEGYNVFSRMTEDTIAITVEPPFYIKKDE